MHCRCCVSRRRKSEVTHNEAVADIDTLLHLAIEAVLGAPPPIPLAGQAWIVAMAASGVWAGRDGAVAAYGGAGWRYITPREGCVAWRRDLQRFAVFAADGWRDDGWPVATLRIGSRTVLGGGMSVVPATSGGAVIDVEVRATVAALAAGLRVQGLVAS